MTRRLILGLVPAALALASFAHAQPAPPSLRDEPPSAELKARHEALQKQHLEDLKTVLRLRPDQEPALAAFVEAHKPKWHERKGPAEPMPLTTPQRLEEMSRHEAEMRAPRRDATGSGQVLRRPVARAAEGVRRAPAPQGAAAVLAACDDGNARRPRRWLPYDDPPPRRPRRRSPAAPLAAVRSRRIVAKSL